MQEKSMPVPAVREKGPKLITSKEMIMQEYPDVFQGIGKFPGPDYHIQLDPSIPPKQTPCQPIPIHLKVQFQQEINKMLQAGVLVPVHDSHSLDQQLCISREQRQAGEPQAAHLLGSNQS